MANAEILIDTEKAAISESCTIFCDICVKLDEDYFPDDLWNDFALMISGWWANSFRRIDYGDGIGEFLFMDGSYKFIIRKIRSGYTIITYKNEKPVAEFPIDNFDRMLSDVKHQFRNLATVSLKLTEKPYLKHGLDKYANFETFKLLISNKDRKKIELDNRQISQLYENMYLIDYLIEFSSDI